MARGSTIRVDEIGVLAIPAKNPAMPTTTNAAGCCTIWGNRSEQDPTAPPVHPPITIEGPNTPGAAARSESRRRREDLAEPRSRPGARRSIDTGASSACWITP